MVTGSSRMSGEARTATMTDTEPRTDRLQARTPEGRALHDEWHDGESFFGAPTECGTLGCGFLGRIVALEEAAEVRATPGLDVERLAEALDTTYDVDGPVRLVLMAPDGTLLTRDEMEYDTASRLANSIAAEYDRLAPGARP